MNLTSKQKSILAIIVEANPDGPVDFDQLIDRLPYVTSKDSMHFSVRALVAKGLIEKGALEPRRGRARRLLTVTPLGEHWAKVLCPPLKLVEIVDLVDKEEMKKFADSIGLPF